MIKIGETHEGYDIYFHSLKTTKVSAFSETKIPYAKIEDQVFPVDSLIKMGLTIDAEKLNEAMTNADNS